MRHLGVLYVLLVAALRCAGEVTAATLTTEYRRAIRARLRQDAARFRAAYSLVRKGTSVRANGSRR